MNDQEFVRKQVCTRIEKIIIRNVGITNNNYNYLFLVMELMARKVDCHEMLELLLMTIKIIYGLSEQ